MAMLTLDDARRVMAAAEAKAVELGCADTITVVDGGGHVRAQSRMDGARFGTLIVSANKAFTAAAFGLPSKVLAEKRLNERLAIRASVLASLGVEEAA